MTEDNGGDNMPRTGARVSSPGLRRKTAEGRRKASGPSASGQKPTVQSSGRRQRGTASPIRECWLCGKRGRKYYVEHHIFTAEEVPDLTIWLCRGSHWLVNLLSRFTLMIDDTRKWADLIMLARSQAKLSNKRIVVKFEEVD